MLIFHSQCNNNKWFLVSGHVSALISCILRWGRSVVIIISLQHLNYLKRNVKYNSNIENLNML